MSSHRIMFDESGFYDEVVTMRDNQCSAKYLRSHLNHPHNDRDEVDGLIGYMVACRGFPKNKVRRFRARALGDLRREERRLWLLIRRKEAAQKGTRA